MLVSMLEKVHLTIGNEILHKFSFVIKGLSMINAALGKIVLRA